MGHIKDAFNAVTGRGADKAIKQGMAAQVTAEREALDYLKEKERVPSMFREQALGQLGGLFGLPGEEGSEGFDKAAFVESLKEDPFYQSQLEAGDEAVLRGQSATGGLRSGASNLALARNSQDILKGMYDERVQGLQGLAGLPSYARDIAAGTAGIGQTIAQGTMGRAQAQQDAITGLINTGLQAGAMFSDPRLKKNVTLIGRLKDLGWFQWEWTNEAKKLGLSGPGFGVMADEVEQKYPKAIGRSNGYMTVNYGEILYG